MLACSNMDLLRRRTVQRHARRGERDCRCLVIAGIIVDDGRKLNRIACNEEAWHDRTN